MAIWKKKRTDYLKLAGKLHGRPDFWERFWKEIHCPSAAGSKYCTNPCPALQLRDCCIICRDLGTCLEADKRCTLLGGDVRKVSAALLGSGRRVA